ncbi:MAG: sigma 54-interacting transcriptional regulator [Pirellulales bacterium]|nr:sigma 54-interacting transcriptional regulator [Pirellulales bacterium]
MSTTDYAYLTLVSGNQAGKSFLLDPSTPISIGRGADCAISLPDLLCSRVHAILSYEAGQWIARDAHSRNGMLVNGERVESRVLEEGMILRVGATELAFRTSTQPMTCVDAIGWTQTIVQDAPVGAPRDEVLAAIPNADQVQELILLYQMSIRLLGCDQPDEVIRIALDLLRDRTGAAVVGFLWINDHGELVPKLVIPPDASDQVKLSQSLTELVLQQSRAIWVASQNDGAGTDGMEHYADAVCVPLVHRSGQGAPHSMGAIHVYLKDGQFRQSDFDFTMSVANIVAVAFARTRSIITLQRDYDRLVADQPCCYEIVGECQAIVELKAKCARVAKAGGAVLIHGESGVGKELVARAIHRASPRADRPLISVNCAAIPAELMESQLFGHKKGAFTGADRDHIGFFQQADMGTLFLDEIGELTLSGQAKLLRVLEGHPFLPVGASEEVHVDVRLLAATNQDLLKFVREKRFREDLYYRLSVFELSVPPLRERDQDIGRLVDLFFDFFRVLHGRPGLRLSKKARDKLLTYSWPGNVRQLRNVMDSAVVLAANETIEPLDLALHDGLDPFETLRLEDWEKKLIREALLRTRDNVPHAAKLLGIGRATLYRKLEQYGIER